MAHPIDSQTHTHPHPSGRRSPGIRLKLVAFLIPLVVLLVLGMSAAVMTVTNRSIRADLLQREYKVSVAGPTTLTALLNSLQMGFRTLAIQKRSSEVWKVLGDVKTEFVKFGEVIEKVEKKLGEASNQLQSVHQRSRVLQRKLKDVQALPAATTAQVQPSLPSLAVADAEADELEAV